MKERKIKLIAEPLGRPSAQAVKNHISPGERNPVEGKFRQGKLKYGSDQSETSNYQRIMGCIDSLSAQSRQFDEAGTFTLILLDYFFLSEATIFMASGSPGGDGLP